MRVLVLIFFSLTFMACKQNRAINNLVTEKLKYSAYYWHFNQQADSSEFYLVHYLEIDKNGKFVLMRHDEWMGKPKYFIGYISDIVRQDIDTTFYYDTYKTDYSWEIDKNGIYDGFDYCLDYQKENNFQKKIQFIPNNSPGQIRSLMISLEELIYKSAILPGGTLNLKDYTEELEQLVVSKQVGRIPKPQKPPPNPKNVQFSK